MNGELNWSSMDFERNPLSIRSEFLASNIFCNSYIESILWKADSQDLLDEVSVRVAVAGRGPIGLDRLLHPIYLQNTSTMNLKIIFKGERGEIITKSSRESERKERVLDRCAHLELACPCRTQQRCLYDKLK